MTKRYCDICEKDGLQKVALILLQKFIKTYWHIPYNVIIYNYRKGNKEIRKQS